MDQDADIDFSKENWKMPTQRKKQQTSGLEITETPACSYS